MAAGARVQRLRAKVLSVDVDARSVTLEGPDGQPERIKVGQAVDRLRELAAGDVIDVEAEEGLLLEYQPVGTPVVAPAAQGGGALTSGGRGPGAVVAAGVQATMVVVGVDLRTGLVTLLGPSGHRHQVKAGPKLPLADLKVGDRLLATCVESVAVRLERSGLPL